MPQKNPTTQNANSLDAIAERVEISAKRLRHIAKTMREFDAGNLDMPRAATLKKSLKWLEDFARDAELTYYEWLEEHTERFGVSDSAETATDE